MSIAEGLGGLRWIRLHVARIAVREIHGQVVGFLLRSTDDHPSFAKACPELAEESAWSALKNVPAARTSLWSGDDDSGRSL